MSNDLSDRSTFLGHPVVVCHKYCINGQVAKYEHLLENCLNTHPVQTMCIPGEDMHSR